MKPKRARKTTTAKETKATKTKATAASAEEAPAKKTVRKATAASGARSVKKTAVSVEAETAEPTSKPVRKTPAKPRATKAKAAEVLAASEAPAPAPVAAAEPAAEPAAPSRRPSSRQPRGRKAAPASKPVVGGFDRGQAEEWRPGGASAPAPTPAAAPAPAPVISNPSDTPSHWQGQSREERIAAAKRQFEKVNPAEVAGRAPEPTPGVEPRERADGIASTPTGEPERRERMDRPERTDRPERPEWRDRRDRRNRHGRHGRPDRHDRHDRQDRRDRQDRPDFAGRSPAEAGYETESIHAEGGAEAIPQGEPVFAEGIIEVSGKGFGFLRDPKRGFAQHPADVFVTPEVCRKYPLRDGMWIKGEIRRGNRGQQLYKLTAIEGEDPEKFRSIPLFEEMTTINPNRWIRLETTPDRFTTRVIDLMAPIGKGQRGIIVAPPRTGKTTYLQHIADAIGQNHPDMKLIILLVDERPEEVTEIKRTVPFAEVMASSNDQDIKSHTRIAQLAIERARRLVELGKDVFILLDSITRVGRAFNNSMGGGGRTMSGGVDARALEIPRKLFAAARNTEEAGSLTIVATALIETGSKMDDLIFQEFKGTGNMELVLDRKISDLRVYPAVDIFQSGTRRDELLLSETDLHKINIIRRGLSGHRPAEAIERLLFFLKKFPTNAQMLREIPG